MTTLVDRRRTADSIGRDPRHLVADFSRVLAASRFPRSRLLHYAGRQRCRFATPMAMRHDGDRNTGPASNQPGRQIRAESQGWTPWARRFAAL
ncbi:hypothetical protein, partial [uncultured Methylobacterium sp.]|uniref:hypothetical protein n=1 Tax=uncultured Methylobacterium sp. TaxID=157278 RepID=UPI0025980174